MSKKYVMQLEATIENLRRDNKILKEELSKYKAIDNANPSEALECLEYLYCVPIGYISIDRDKDYNTIKQALTTKSKKEQAFDVIKEKNVDIVLLKMCACVGYYNHQIQTLPIYCL